MSIFKQPTPTRISITVPWHVFAALRDRADEEGRSTSNLGAFLLELALSHHDLPSDEQERQS